ncbi:hypothetical protein AT03_07960 [Hafnia alvei FB1]|uniref:Uncharacterized protein n=1 Tax=Hafnia alvei FB1 TaxID=1453496 RepID=A0A097R0R5_HAFAL|nr:DUF6236 family protein [Hafnia alvei]AIU72328.1 hypothetical protein AT03_07960 [Hafnia alvei FB1]TBL61249.1 hypothetical protein EYY92_07995 [Hafnia alvei]
MKRGIVTNPTSMGFYSDNSIVNIGASLLESDINYFCFYWDDIVILNSENIQSIVPKEKELLDNGILRRPIMKHEGMMDIMEFPYLYSRFQAKTLDELREQEKGTDWYYHQTGDNLLYDKDKKTSLQLRMELLDVLRVPDDGIHVEDILKFKDDCKDDLNALHEYIDKLYFEVLQSKDFDITRAKNFSLLNEAIANLDRATGFKWKNPIRMGVKVSPEVDSGQVIELLSPIVNGVISGYYGGVIPGMIAAAATAIPSFIKFQPQWVGIRDKGNQELAYLTKAQRKGLIDSQR